MIRTLTVLKRVARQNAMFYLAAIITALLLKQYYSQARPEDLHWILRPTAGLVSMLSGYRFAFVAGTGYVCDAAGVIIAPGCAGVNFMLMVFGMASFAGLHHTRRDRHRFAWLLFCLVSAYAWTLGVNTFRILASIHTFHADIFKFGMTWEWVHRMEGIVIYFFFQYLFYSMIRKIIERYRPADPNRKSGWRRTFSEYPFDILKTTATGLIPCAWYLAVTLAVPFFNNAPQKTGSRFFDHAAMVFSLCLATWICIVFVRLCGQGARILFTGYYRKHEARNTDR